MDAETIIAINRMAVMHFIEWLQENRYVKPGKSARDEMLRWYEEGAEKDDER